MNITPFRINSRVTHAHSIFICYSPMHVYSISIITSSLGLTDFLCFVPYGISYSLIPRAKVINYFYSDFSKPAFTKLFSFLQTYSLFFNVYFSSYDLYIPNHSDPFVGLIKTSISHACLHYIDEGNIALTCIRVQIEGVQKSLSLSSRVLSLLFRLKLQKHVVCSMQYASAWILFPDILLKFVIPSRVIYSLAEYISYVEPCQSIDIPSSTFDIVILTSPLTENKYIIDNQEVAIISDYISSIIASCECPPRILVKTHYRENLSKYDALHSQPAPLTIMNSSCSLPYQAFHNTYRPHTVVAFYTSAMFVQDATIISLIRYLPQTPIISKLYSGLREISEYGFNIHFDY